MLKELNIEDKLFLYDCLVKSDVIEYNLYEADENWTEVKTQAEVTQTLQLLNKRIKYNIDTAFDTLQNAQPETANWVVADTATNQPAACVRVLKLKYRVKGCPFNFEWHLKKQDNSLAIQLPINQVASLVETLPAQIEELLDVLRRKEDEIKQYRTEYGSLRLSTRATKAFDVDTFCEQYAATAIKVKSLQKIIARWRAEHADAEVESIACAELPTSSNSSHKTIVKKEETETSSPSTRRKLQDSPRNRKRKALQAHKAQLTRTLQARRPRLEYESQSQSLTDNEQPQDNKEVIAAMADIIEPADEAFEFLNGNDAGSSEIQELSSKYTKDLKTNAAIPTKEEEKHVEKDKHHNVLDKYAKDPTNSTTKAAISPITKDTNEVGKEIASKSKIISPRLGMRSKTPQRLRECVTPDSNSNDLLLIENPSENVTYTVDEEGTVPVLSLSVTSADVKQNESKKCSTPALHISKMEQRRDDISSYVDSVLSQFDALDKHDAGSNEIQAVSSKYTKDLKTNAAILTKKEEKVVEKIKDQKVLDKYAKEPTNSTAKSAAPQITKNTSEVGKEKASKSKRISPRLGMRSNTRQHLRECATPDSNSNDLLLIENPSENVTYTVVEEGTEPVLSVSVTSAVAKQNKSKKSSTPALHISKKEQGRDDISSYVDSVLSQLDALDKDDAGGSEIQEVSSKYTKDLKTNAAKPTKEEEKDVEKIKHQNVLEKYAKVPTNSTPKAANSPITKDTSEVGKEIASKSKRISPRLGMRSKTPQLLRECATPDSNSNDLLLIENPSENVTYTVDEEGTESMLSLSVTSAVSKQNESKKCSTPAFHINKMEQRRDDISSYVDSVLSQLDALDKEFKSQW